MKVALAKDGVGFESLSVSSCREKISPNVPPGRIANLNHHIVHMR